MEMTNTPAVAGNMPRVAIVTTSINPAPASYIQWAKQGTLIVAGDQNTPDTLKDFVTSLDGHYLHPQSQDAYTPGGEYLGWRNIQRRNAATWYALVGKEYDYIVTVDDDNFPAQAPNSPQAWIHGHIMNLYAFPESVVGNSSGFVNTGDLCLPPFHQRGVPYGVDTRPRVSRLYDRKMRPGSVPHVVVSQAQVLGSPDCDAVERIANDPTISAVQTDAIIEPGVYAAFNTQATVWKASYAPLLAVMPGIGRYDDIFGSYIFQRLGREYNFTNYVGTPCVTQHRNEHNLAADLRAELFGMNVTLDFCRALDQAHISADMPLVESYGELITAVAHLLPSEAVKFAQAWARAWREEL